MYFFKFCATVYGEIKMCKISWADKKTNDEIQNMVEEDGKILNTVWCRKHKWMGHVLRHDGLLRDVLVGRMLGKRTRGRRRI